VSQAGCQNIGSANPYPASAKLLVLQQWLIRPLVLAVLSPLSVDRYVMLQQRKRPTLRDRAADVRLPSPML
jgi:hypothetical protein